LISYGKKNLTTTFIQLLRTKTIKNKIENKYSEKNHEKKKKREKSYLNIVCKLEYPIKNYFNLKILVFR
jgi:hypothetical protein